MSLSPSRDHIVQFLRQQLDTYAYLHDQTLHMLSQAYTGIEMAENTTLSPTLDAMPMR